jgi:signal peptidase I
VWLAFVLGWLFPGLGHVYAGALLRAVLAIAVLWIVLLPAGTLVRVLLDFSPGAVILGLALSLAFTLVVPIDGALTARRRRTEPPRRWNRLLVYAAYAVLVTLLSWPLSAWWMENSPFRTFKIPSGAMADTLLIGDYIIADMRSSKLFPVQRGEVVVFRQPEEPAVFNVKRVVGLPGETIELRQGLLYVDGQRFEEPYIEDSYKDRDPKKNFGPIVVSDQHFFMLGDHRNQSADSRFIGQIPSALLEGRVRSIWLSYDEPPGAIYMTAPERLRAWLNRWHQLFTRTRWDRVGRAVTSPP